MKIVLFDTDTSGHHLTYAKYLITYFLNNGYKVFFITSKYNSINYNNDNLSVIYLNNKNSGFIQIKNFQYSLQLTAEINADLVHWLHLDFKQIFAFLSLSTSKGFNKKIFATLFWNHLSKNKQLHQSIISIIKMYIQAYAFKKILKNKYFTGVFVPTYQMKYDLIENLHLSPALGEKIDIIPDPAPSDVKIIDKLLAKKS